MMGFAALNPSYDLRSREFLMDYKGPHGIVVLEALQAIRRRPAMYIGREDEHPSPRARLLEIAISDIAYERRPQEVRILLWREGVVTIAYDGSPLPIEPPARPVDDIPYPALYQSFMYLHTPAMNGMAVLNALSERLVVSTMHDGRRYRGVFSKGMIVSLLHHAHCGRPLGNTWLTYLPDITTVAGEVLKLRDVQQIPERVGRTVQQIAERFGRTVEDVPIRVEDRMTEDADWY
jgi:DNA gyrase/topoisomerase IV subunit B